MGGGSGWFLSAGQRAPKQQEKLLKCVSPNNLHNLSSMSRSGVCGSFTSGRERTLTHLDIPEKYVKLELWREEEEGSPTCKYEEIEEEKCDGPGGFDVCVCVGGDKGRFHTQFQSQLWFPSPYAPR